MRRFKMVVCLSFSFSLLIMFCGCYSASIDLSQCVSDFNKLPAQSDFNLQKFVGAWYTFSATSYVYRDNMWDSMSNVMYVRKDRTLTAVTSGMSPMTHRCEIAIIDFTEDSRGRYTGSFFGTKVQMVILHADDMSAAMVYCFDIKPDGTCQHNKMQIETWSRTPENLSKEGLTHIMSYLDNIECFVVDHLTPMKHGNCETASSSELIESAVTVNGGRPESDTEIFFYGERPSGDYHTLYDAVQEGVTPTALNLKFIPSHNNKILYVTKSQQSGDVCEEIQVEKYRMIDDDHYLQVGEPVPKEIWFGKDKEVIAMFTCYYRQKGKCTDGRLQGLIQSNTHIRFDTLQGFNNILVYMFKDNYKMFIDQHTDLCKVPELLGEVIKVSDTGRYNPSELRTDGHTTQMQIGQCALKSIPIEESLSLRELEGLWYEIARPMNIHNQYDSAVAYFHYNEDNTLHSSYSGAIDGKCAPAITTHTMHLEGSPYDAEMMAKIHGPDDVFRYMNFKIVYYDGTYSVHYGCFVTDTNGNCLYAEASIYGRQPTIDDDTYNRLLDVYQKLCLSRDYMQRTMHHVDCSDWVKGDNGPLTPQCNVQDIPVQSQVNDDQLVGVWQIIAGMHAKARTIHIRREGNGLMVDLYKEKNGKCKFLMSVSMTRYDRDKKDGTFLASPQTGNMQMYNTLKVVYTDYYSALFYMCFDENIHGSCPLNGTRILMLNRKPTIDSSTRTVLENKLKLPCGDLSNLRTYTGHCMTIRSCTIDDIPVMTDIDKNRLTGMWYEIVGRQGTSGVVKYSLDEDGHLTCQITGLRNDGTCINPPKAVDMKSHGAGGDFLNMMMAPIKAKGFVPFKILYTDYDNYLVMYVCLDVLVNGECSAKGQKFGVLGRTKTMTADKRSELTKYADAACVDQSTLKTSLHDVDCSSVLS